MMKNLRYSTTIKARPLLYLEMKKAATLVVEGNILEQVKKLILEENIYQVKTESRKKEFASIVSSRLQVLDEFLMKQLVCGDVETSKLIVLYTIIKTDRLFYEFMDEVIKDKYMSIYH
ncbi:BrxA family protein [Bacillus mycoides]|uniref:BrxA family protein n=1 Tax=Bacillus mycoides TaxID=1405 RepID=UPI003D257026